MRSSQRRSRGAKMLLSLALLGIAAIGSLVVTSERSSVAVARGLGSTIQYQPGTQVPDPVWDSIAPSTTAKRHQVMVGFATLDSSGRTAALIVPAPRRFDVHVPTFPLIIAVTGADHGLQVMETDLECRPDRIGSFAHQGWWDLRCADGRGTLRWDGIGYRA